MCWLTVLCGIICQSRKQGLQFTLNIPPTWQQPQRVTTIGHLVYTTNFSPNISASWLVDHSATWLRWIVSEMYVWVYPVQTVTGQICWQTNSPSVKSQTGQLAEMFGAKFGKTIAPNVIFTNSLLANWPFCNCPVRNLTDRELVCQWIVQ